MLMTTSSAAQGAVASSFAGKALKPRTVVRAQAARSATIVAAALPSRPLWLPGGDVPPHLDGSLAGDFGFDPLNLGRDKESLKWYQQAELVHGRLAMTAVAGILIPALLTKIGILNVPDWFIAGREAQKGAIAPFSTLLAVQLILTGFVEVKRWVDFRKPSSQAEPGSFLGFESQFKGVENGYPGGVFDPMGFSKGGNFDEYKVKEIKNGRLAMVAFLGFVAQAAATGKGPLDNLFTHLANPTLNNFTTNGVSLPFKI
jgi:light-harvesting complex I chlorophyll a/b binding protein 5